MKSKIVLFFTFLSFSVVAQDTTLVTSPITSGGGINVNYLIGVEESLFSALLLIFSFLSYMIPGLKSINSKHIRTLSIGLILVFAFVSYKLSAGDGFNIGQIINYLISYILTTGAYDKIFKPLGLVTQNPPENK
jgi:hypothetical protein